MQYKQLTLNQRYQIGALLTLGFSVNSVAKRLEVHRTTINRELERNSSQGRYCPYTAHEKAIQRKRSAKKRNWFTGEICSFIWDALKKGWSPEQIYGYCKRHGIAMVSHTSIYRHIAKNKKKGGDLHTFLRRAKKRKRKYGGPKIKPPEFKNRVSIDLRPQIVDERIRIGDLEADLILGKNRKGAILTIVDRCSRYVFAKLLPDKKAKTVMDAIIELLSPVIDNVHTITVDNGMEFAWHEKIAHQLNTKVYFAHPYASWERGTSENTNGLVRQFIPKGSSFDGLVDDDIKKIVQMINCRPRKVLGFDVPEEFFTKGIVV